LRDVARDVPNDRLLAETDCPYLTPVPYRGRRNEPKYVLETVRMLASLKGISVEEMASLTSSNFIRFFGLDSKS
jgi:TatD DNase family protein